MPFIRLHSLNGDPLLVRVETIAAVLRHDGISLIAAGAQVGRVGGVATLARPRESVDEIAALIDDSGEPVYQLPKEGQP